MNQEVTHRDLVLDSLECSGLLNKFNSIEPKVLDVGCFDNRLKYYFESKGFRWLGVDKISNPEVIIDDMSLLAKFKDNSIDLLFVCHSFEHCLNPIAALINFKRVLRKGGYLFIATPNPCFEQIFGADEDHIFCLNEIQMKKLLTFMKFNDIKVLTSTMYQGEILSERNKNIITIGHK